LLYNESFLYLTGKATQSTYYETKSQAGKQGRAKSQEKSESKLSIEKVTNIKRTHQKRDMKLMKLRIIQSYPINP